MSGVNSSENCCKSTTPFYLGCAVWSYAGWVGNLYPPKSRFQDFLNLYSQRFTTVEGNTTFYAVPPAKTIARWQEQTSAGFKFCLKFPQEITHRGLLAEKIPQAQSFLDRISGLQDRLGTTFIQLPPGYNPEYLDDLQGFLRVCSEINPNLAVEVRHLEWFASPHGDRLNKILSDLNIARVLLDTRPLYNSPDDPQANSNRRKPKVPLQPIVTGDVAFVRFISHPERQYNESWLQEWLPQIKTWLQQEKTVYFFVHCPQEERSPETARYFYNLLKEQIDIPDLSWDAIAPFPTQLSLF